MQTTEQWAQQWASHQAWSLKGMTEFIRAIQADAGPPEGYVLAPLEPTSTMQFEGLLAFTEYLKHSGPKQESEIKVIYKAMVKAVKPNLERAVELFVRGLFNADK